MRLFHSTTLIALLLLMFGCSPESAASQPALARPLRPGNHQLQLAVDGRERTYLLHIPPQAARAASLPLLLVLHGSYGSGRKMEIGLGFDQYANRRGFLVAYPDAYQDMRWNDGRGTLASSAAGIDDVAFLTRLVDDVAARASVDRSRVYVTGASNGGMMAYRLGCETKGVFAGIAPVIANIPEPIAASCAPQARLALLSINGDGDPYIPFEGGEVCADVRRGCEHGVVLSAEASLRRFAAANGCALAPRSTQLPAQVADGTSVERHDYPGCRSGAQVQLYVVHGGGHAWPPRDPQLPGGGAASANLDATQVIVAAFFP